MLFNSRILRLTFIAGFAALIFRGSLTAAQAPILITSAVNPGQLVALPASTHPLAQKQFDQGPAPDTLPMERMLLVLKRDPQREAALTQFLEELQTPGSPNFHKWLTPDEFGQQFGASDSDIQTVTSWLESYGFDVKPASKGRTFIEFSGNAGQVRNAFHAAIHKFVVNGQEHWANAGNQQIPLALAGAVAGVSTLHNFLSTPQVSVAATHVTATFTPGSPIPQYTDGDSYYLTPGDYATIYNAKPLYPAITGAGITIAVVGRSNISVSDIVAFRSVLGLRPNPPNIIVNGPDPGILGGSEETEAVLDTSWAGAIATAATVDLVVSKSTASTDGVELSEAYIVDNNLANVMTESFGSCEASLTSAQQKSFSSLAQQAAAQGITFTVSAGDAGSAGCDNFETESSATGPLSVNGLGSTPYNIAVGGTQFNEGNTPSLYWSSTNSSTRSSALSYIPEDVWNANCTGASCGASSIIAGGGGASVVFAKPSWQSSVTGIPADEARDVPDVSLTAAGHDSYLLCLAGSCGGASPGFYAVYGTSAAAPSFASIVALIDQKAGSRQGQIAPELYHLAALESLSSCNGSNNASLPAAKCIFHDVTIGANAVPGEANYNTASQTYSSTVGFDLASGLGSVNIANLVDAWGVPASVPLASLSATSLAFALQPVGKTSPAQVVTLSNTGKVALSIASIAISGADSSDFSSSTKCGASLAAGASCTISVSFAPHAFGTRTAKLVVTDNATGAAGSTQTCHLTGTADVPVVASAVYHGPDTATLGTWTGHYGVDGQWIANGLTNTPAYGILAMTGDSTYTWTTSTTDSRALQAASGASQRMASTYFAANNNTFTFDANFTDGNTHRLSLYLCDWDRQGRAETISIVDAASQTVLNKQSFSSFTGGVYAVWNVKGHVQIKVARTAGVNAIINALFFDPAATAVTSSAAYTGADTTTLGSWTGKYGVNGQWIANDLSAVPSYATLSISGASTYTWTPSTTDLRALQKVSGSSTRIASTYFAIKDNTFTFDLNLTDGKTHKIALYLCDWDRQGRAESISIVDSATQTVLNTQSFSSFTGGVYAVWTVKGRVQIKITKTAGLNAIVNALFFDPLTGATASAGYTGADTATQGSWTNKYGANGQVIANDVTNVAEYATVAFTGETAYTWTTSTADLRALQTAGGSSTRIASTYVAINKKSFTFDVNLTDGKTHKISLYLCDWDSQGRAETISIVDAASQAVLNSQSFSSFTSGIYATWNVKGHVQIQITRTAGLNAIVNAFFFDPPSPAIATFAGADTTTQGTWTGKFGADGQLIANDLNKVPAYASLGIAGDSTYTWTTSTTDERALQTASGSSSRIASAFFAAGDFILDVNLTDGKSHKISLYLCDWDDNGRAETVSTMDAVTGATLNTQRFSSFAGGVYAVYQVKGHVQMKVTRTQGINAIANALFFN
jgi:hypothetical protein